MQTLKTILYNASILGLLSELSKKYPQPIIIYENAAHLMREDHSDFYQALAKINGHWISRNFDYDQSVTNEINFLHLFCVDKVSDSIHLISNHILRNSNTFRIQNIILSDHESHEVKAEIFAKYDSLSWNTLICERDTERIICWYWIISNDRSDKTLEELLSAPINLNSLEIQISAHNSPPMAFTPCFFRKFLFTGGDAMVLAEILSTLNASPRYCNKAIVSQMKKTECNREDKITDDDAMKLIQQQKYNGITHPFQIYAHTIFDSRMVKYLFYERAQCDGRIDLQMNTGTLSSNNSTMKNLTPTEFSCILVILPKANAASSFIRQTFYNSTESIGFIVTVLLFTIGPRDESPLRKWFDILYSTFVVFLSQTCLTSKTTAERILYGLLLNMSVVTSVLLSSLIFTNLVNNPSSKPVQTLNDLAASDFKILTLDNVGNWIDNLRDDIREKVAVVPYPELLNDLFRMEKTSAYAMHENLYGLFKGQDTARNLEYDIHNTYYEMKEKLHCGYFAYQIANDFPLEDEINEILQRMVAHGFIGAFKKWSLHIMKTTSLFTFSLTAENVPISLGNIFGIFCAYFIGIGISLIVLVCEMVIKALRVTTIRR